MRTAFLTTLLSALAWLCIARESRAQQPPRADSPATPPPAAAAEAESPPLDELTAEAEAAVSALRAALPADSEASAMLDDILKGSTLGPTDGWFALAQAQSRYPWATVATRYDGDADGSVTPEEFGGDEADFARLDRDGDDALTEADFDWSEPTSSRSVGMALFGQADRDANGKVTAEEFQELFTRIDEDHRGFLALDELKERFAPPPSRGRNNWPDKPSRSTLILGLQRQEIGSLQPGPALEEIAPDFTLTSLDGQSVTLSAEIGNQPVVLIFGNFTCGPFRSQSGNIEKLYERYKDRARFFLVYVREAHPSDGWWMNSNRRAGIDLSQPQDDAARVEVARTCQQHLDLDLPFLVDSTDDKVGATYSGMPNRLYLIDSEGKIAFKNGRGPFGFKSRQLEQALILLLNEAQ